MSRRSLSSFGVVASRDRFGDVSIAPIAGALRALGHEWRRQRRPTLAIAFTYARTRTARSVCDDPERPAGPARTAQFRAKRKPCGCGRKLAPALGGCDGSRW